MFIEQATVTTVINYDRKTFIVQPTDTSVINYDYGTFIVQATGLIFLKNFQASLIFEGKARSLPMTSLLSIGLYVIIWNSLKTCHRQTL